MSCYQQLIRLDFEESFHHVDNQALLHQYHAEMVQADTVVLSGSSMGR